MLQCILKDANQNEKARFEGEEIEAVLEASYQEGDTFYVTTDCDFVEVSFNKSQKPSIVYVPDHTLSYTVPLGEFLIACDAQAWQAESHPILVKPVSDEVAYSYRNIAHNGVDDADSHNVFPHAEANHVTRNEPVFRARNAIDGVCDNEGHGYYPYQCWAGGARDDLEFHLDFGAPVEVDKITFYLRADFPHDSYWNEADISFSDETTVHASFEKTADAQTVTFEKRETTYIHLSNFKQPIFPLSWAALCQIEVYGNYKEKENKTMEVRQASNAKDVKFYTTERLREEFHISNLFTKDNFKMVYSHIDRIITAGFMPLYYELKLEGSKELASEYFLERREMGCINIGGKGIITVDGVEYEMNPRDGIYIGMGNKEVTFKAVDPENPPKFYVSSCPAHTQYPIVKIDITKAKKVPCGSVEDCNKRVINQYIHPEVMKSCQLSMGLTQLEPGSNWNTMPCHTHDRRMEVYLYLDMGENDAVFHMMGEPKQTRHIIMHNEEAVISPSWSIHSGVGTKNYSFIWAMCGENQEFTDMDGIATKDLR